MTENTKTVQDLANKFQKKYGDKAGSTGNVEWPLDVVPTGSLSLDYSLGIGGWPMGHLIEVFGPPDVGKSSVIGLNAIANAQALGKVCAIVAVEPGFDPSWAEKHGVNTENLLIARPDNGQEAFNMLAEIVSVPEVGFVLFDSVGALLRESEAEIDGKPAQGGRSGLITWGVHNVLQPAWKNNTGIMFINQIRDKMNARMPGVVDSPGGHALKHSCSIRVQLRAAEFYKEKLENKDEAEVGHRLKATILRNKFSEGSRRTAEFDYYKMTTSTHEVGIDKGADIIDVATRLGCIQPAGAWYRHPSFPGDKNQIQGKAAVGEFVMNNPKIQEQLRQEVLEAMIKETGPIDNVKPAEGAIEDGS
jgi:recombination protein RecA